MLLVLLSHVSAPAPQINAQMAMSMADPTSPSSHTDRGGGQGGDPVRRQGGHGVAGGEQRGW